MRSLQILSLLIVFTGGQIQADVIDFESDSIGSKPNGFQSADSALVSFSDSSGADLEVIEFPSGNNILTVGGAGGVTAPDLSAMILDFSVLVDSLSFDFGGDDPTFVDSNDFALLTLFDGVSQVGQTSVALTNPPNILLDQTISFSGTPFDQAVFTFADSSNNPITGSEGIDNINFTVASASSVPEPSSIAMLCVGAGLFGISSYRRKRRKDQTSTAA